MLDKDSKICKDLEKDICGKKNKKNKDSSGFGATCACLGFNSKDDAAKDIIEALGEKNRESKTYYHVSSPFFLQCIMLSLISDTNICFPFVTITIRPVLSTSPSVK
jgi:hypothetical protein